MAGEVLSKWERFVTNPVFKRYGKYPKEPRALFELIGEDLASSSQEVREQAYWALVVAMPRLTSTLHEWESRQPGWRDIEGKDQQTVNRSMDILSHLHQEFVVKHHFKIGGRYGKDPRPFVNEEIKNKKIDEWRKRKREVLLDYDATLKIPDPGPSLEDTVIENESYEDWKREFRRFSKGGDELDLLITAHVDDTPLAEILESNGIAYGPTQRKQFSRARQQAVELRDAWFAILLIYSRALRLEGKLPQSSTYEYGKNSHEFLKTLELYVELAKVSIQPGLYLNRVGTTEGQPFLVARPLTRGLRDAPGKLYLVALHKDYEYIMEWLDDWDWPEGSYIPSCSYGYHRQIINKFIYPDKDPFKIMFTFCPLLSYPTELPRLNKALAEVPDVYGAWLFSFRTFNKRIDI
jgi:DNA-directed RNA polymerase specialized sigma24 family protein